jgi:hypothetical protein
MGNSYGRSFLTATRARNPAGNIRTGLIRSGTPGGHGIGLRHPSSWQAELPEIVQVLHTCHQSLQPSERRGRSSRVLDSGRPSAPAQSDTHGGGGRIREALTDVPGAVWLCQPPMATRTCSRGLRGRRSRIASLRHIDHRAGPYCARRNPAAHRRLVCNPVWRLPKGDVELPPHYGRGDYSVRLYRPRRGGDNRELENSRRKYSAADYVIAGAD